MLSQSLRTRGVKFAFLIGPPRFISRDEATSMYSAVCDALSQDDLTFGYRASDSEGKPSSRGFSISLSRKEGRGGFAVTIDNKGIQTPIRLLLAYEWAPSVEHVREQFDATANAVLETLEGEWQKIVAEVRLQAQCAVPGNSGIQFILDSILGLRHEWVDSLGKPLGMASIKLEIDASKSEIGDSLSCPKRELMIEVLREDPKSVYLELMTMWPQVLMPTVPGEQVVIDTSSLRPIDKLPSEYVGEALEFLRERVAELEEG